MDINIFEGIDGAGKSTAARALCDFWESKGKKVISLREPSGYFRTILAQSLPKGDLPHLDEWMAFWMGRFEIWRHEILPYQDEDIVVIIDRSYASTYAYQIEGRSLAHFTTSFFFWKTQLLSMFKPNSIRVNHFYLRLSVETGLSRIGIRNVGDLKQFETEEILRRVKFGFDFYYDPKNARSHLASNECVRVINAELPPENVCAAIRATLVDDSKESVA